MKLFSLLVLLATVAYSLIYSACSVDPVIHYDVVVYGATPGGIAAAIAACETAFSPTSTTTSRRSTTNIQKPRVLLIEPTKHVGGMASQGGIGLRDGPEYMRSDPLSSQYRWGRRNANYYGIASSVDPPHGRRGGGVIWQPDNWVGELSFRAMIEEAGVELLLESDYIEGPSGIHRRTHESSQWIDALQLENGTLIHGKYFIDASYEGDLMRDAGVDCTYGREGSHVYHEAWAGVTNGSAAQFDIPIHPFEPTGALLPYIQRKCSDPFRNRGQSDSNVMAFSYRVCVTRDSNNSVPVKQPPHYNSSDFELARRFVQAQLAFNLSLSRPWLNLDYRGYNLIPDRQMKYDACCGLSPVGIDAVGLARGYARGSRKRRREIAADHRYYVQGLMWFWANDQIIPQKIGEEQLAFGLCADEWGDNHNFPRQLYVRESLRLVGDEIFTQNDRQEGCRRDSVGVGTWGLDIHDMQRIAVLDKHGWRVVNEGLTGDNQGAIFPFDLPYWLILPKASQLANLAVVNCPSVSHVAWGAVREEPTLWQLGVAAGAAATIAWSSGAMNSLHTVNVSDLQAAIVRQGGVIHWPPNRTCEIPATIY